MKTSPGHNLNRKVDSATALKRPKGDQPSFYEGAVSSWGPRRLAWEFLRRSPDFIRRCEAALSEDSKATVAADFGLCVFKSYREPFRKVDNKLFAKNVCPQGGRLRGFKDFGRFLQALDLEAEGHRPSVIGPLVWPELANSVNKDSQFRKRLAKAREWANSGYRKLARLTPAQFNALVDRHPNVPPRKKKAAGAVASTPLV